MIHYMDALPGSRELITVIKAFLSQRSMNEVFTGGLGSYSVICMVVSFMQMHPKLRRSEMNAQRNLGTLLIEFFELYGRSFNYADVGISLRRGGSYFLKSQRGWVKPGGNGRPSSQFLLSIEDPQSIDNDISSGSFGLPRVKMTLGGAYDMIRERMFERAAHIAVRDQIRRGEDVDRSARKSVPKSPGDWSILSSVMGVTAETLKFREHLAELHRNGRMERDFLYKMERLGVDARLKNPPLRPAEAAAAREQREQAFLAEGRQVNEPPQERQQASGSGRFDMNAAHGIDGNGSEDGEIAEPGAGPAGAIVVDDDSAVSDGASSHTDDPESDSDSSFTAGVGLQGRAGSVSEDMDLYDSDDSEEEESRYTAAMKGKGRQQVRRDAFDDERSAGRSRGEDEGEGRKRQRGKRQPDYADSGSSTPANGGKKKRRGKKAKATADGANTGGNGGLSIKGAAQPKANNKQNGKGKQKGKQKAVSASAGPSRTSTPPIQVFGASASSAPTSPNGRPDKWVRPAARAAYWAAKKGEAIDLTGASSD